MGSAPSLFEQGGRKRGEGDRDSVGREGEKGKGERGEGVPFLLTKIIVCDYNSDNDLKYVNSSLTTKIIP